MSYNWPKVELFPVANVTVKPLSRAVAGLSLTLQQTKANKYRRLFQAARETIKTPFISAPFEPPKRAELPDHFIVDEVELGGRKTRLVQSKSVQSKATFVLPLGHGTDAAYYVNTASFFYAHGVDVRILELPVPEENTHFSDGITITDGYDDTISHGILDKNSPVLDGIHSFHSVYLMPHSSSGQSLERVMLTQPDKATFALENFEHVYQTGTMLDTANSSHRHNPRLSKLYLKYSGHPNVSPQIAGSTIVDREWLSGNLGVDDCFFEDISTNATHGQARHLKLAGIKLFNDVSSAIKSGEDLERFMAVPRTFLHGKIDESACPLTIKDYATLLRMRFKKYAKVGHSVAQNPRIDRAILGHAFHQVPIGYLSNGPSNNGGVSQAALASPCNAPHAT